MGWCENYEIRIKCLNSHRKIEKNETYNVSNNDKNIMKNHTKTRKHQMYKSEWKHQTKIIYEIRLKLYLKKEWFSTQKIQKAKTAHQFKIL